MKNKKIYILLFIALFSLLLVKTNDIKVSANTGIVSDPETTGLWHEIVEEDNTYKAYVYMRNYYSWTDNLTQQNFKSDHPAVGSNIPHAFNLGTALRFDEPSMSNVQAGHTSSKTISAPAQFETLYIKSISSDGTTTNRYVGNAKHIKITLFIDYFMENTTTVSITDMERNAVIYEFNRFNHSSFLMYWEGYDVTPPDINDPDTPINNVGFDYTELPFINRKFIQIEKIELVSSNIHRFTIDINFELWSFDLTLPEDIKIEDYKLTDGKYNISYSTYKDISKFLYLQPDKTKNPYPVEYGTIDDPAELMIGFITIDISDPDNIKTERIETFRMTSIISKEHGANAYMYAFFPMLLDDIINIHIKYTYRYKYFGFSGAWQEVENIYYWKESSKYRIQWWASALVGSMLVFAKDIETIQKLTISDIDSDIVARYNNLEMAKEYDLEDLQKFKIHLGHFSIFGSTNYDISEYEVTDITYIYKGVIYNTPGDEIDDEQDLPSIGGELDFKGFFKFTGVTDFSSFINHLFKFWKETIVLFFSVVIGFYAIGLLSRAINFVKPKKHYNYNNYNRKRYYR